MYENIQYSVKSSSFPGQLKSSLDYNNKREKHATNVDIF